MTTATSFPILRKSSYLNATIIPFMYYKEGILCLMFAMAEADGNVGDNELIHLVSMKNIFPAYTEGAIMGLYREYQEKFKDSTYSEIAAGMIRHIPEELYMGTLSLLADVAVCNFDVDVKESSLLSIIANMMNVSDTAVKVLLLSSLSKKLLLDVGKQ